MLLFQISLKRVVHEKNGRDGEILLHTKLSFLSTEFKQSIRVTCILFYRIVFCSVGKGEGIVFYSGCARFISLTERRLP